MHGSRSSSVGKTPTSSHKTGAKKPSKPSKLKKRKLLIPLPTTTALRSFTSQSSDSNRRFKDAGSIMDDWEAQASAHIKKQQQQSAQKQAVAALLAVSTTKKPSKNDKSIGQQKGKGGKGGATQQDDDDDNGFFGATGRVRGGQVIDQKKVAKKQQELLTAQKTIDLIRKMKPVVAPEGFKADNGLLNTKMQNNHNDSVQSFQSMNANDDGDDTIADFTNSKVSKKHHAGNLGGDQYDYDDGDNNNNNNDGDSHFPSTQLVIATKKSESFVFDPTKDHYDIDETPPTADELQKHLKMLTRNFRNLSKSNEILHTLGTFLGSFDLSPALTHSIQDLSKRLGEYHNKYNLPYQLHLNHLLIDTLSLDTRTPTQRFALLPSNPAIAGANPTPKKKKGNKKGLEEEVNNNKDKGQFDFARLSKHALFIPGTKKAARGAFGSHYSAQEIEMGLHRIAKTRLRYAKNEDGEEGDDGNGDDDNGDAKPRGSIEIQSITVPDRIVYNTIITALLKNVMMAFPTAMHNPPSIPSPSMHNAANVLSHPASLQQLHKAKTYKNHRIKAHLATWEDNDEDELEGDSMGDDDEGDDPFADGLDDIDEESSEDPDKKPKSNSKKTPNDAKSKKMAKKGKNGKKKDDFDDEFSDLDLDKIDGIEFIDQIDQEFDDDEFSEEKQADSDIENDNDDEKQEDNANEDDNNDDDKNDEKDENGNDKKGTKNKNKKDKHVPTPPKKKVSPIIETDQTAAFSDLLVDYYQSGKVFGSGSQTNLISKHKRDKSLQKYLSKMTKKTPIEAHQELHQHPSIILTFKLIDYMTQVSSDPSVMVDALIERQLAHFETQVEKLKKKQQQNRFFSKKGHQNVETPLDLLSDDDSDPVSDDLDLNFDDMRMLGLDGDDGSNGQVSAKFVEKQKRKAKLRQKHTPFFPPEESNDLSFYSNWADKNNQANEGDDGDDGDDDEAEIQADMPLVTLTNEVISHLYKIGDECTPQLDTILSLSKLAASHSNPTLARALFLRVIQLDLVHISKLEEIMHTKQGNFEAARKIQSDIKSLQSSILQALTSKSPLSPPQYTQFMALWDHITTVPMAKRPAVKRSQAQQELLDIGGPETHRFTLQSNPWLEWIFPAGIYIDGLSDGVDINSVLDFGAAIDVSKWSNPQRLTPHKLPISPKALLSAIKTCSYPLFWETAFQSSNRVMATMLTHQLQFQPKWVQLQIMEDLLTHQKKIAQNARFSVEIGGLPLDPRSNTPYHADHLDGIGGEDVQGGKGQGEVAIIPPLALVPTTIGAELPTPIPQRLDLIKNSIRFWVSTQHIKSFNRVFATQTYFTNSLLILLKQSLTPSPHDLINGASNNLQRFQKTPKILAYEQNNGEFDEGTNGAAGGTIPQEFYSGLFNIANQLPYHSFALANRKFPDTALLGDTEMVIDLDGGVASSTEGGDDNATNENEKKKKNNDKKKAIKTNNDQGDQDTNSPDGNDLSQSDDIDDENAMIIDLVDNNHMLGLGLDGLSDNARKTLDYAQTTLDQISSLLFTQGIITLNSLPQPTRRPKVQKNASQPTVTTNNDVLDALPPLSLNHTLSSNPLIEQYLSHVPRVQLSQQTQLKLFGGMVRDPTQPDQPPQHVPAAFNKISIDLGCGDGEHSINQAESASILSQNTDITRDAVLACDILDHRLANMFTAYHKRRSQIPSVLSHSSNDSPLDLFTSLDADDLTPQGMRKRATKRAVASAAGEATGGDIPINESLAIPVQQLAQKLMVLPGAVADGVTYEECINDILMMIQLHITASNEMIEANDSKLFLGVGHNNNNNNTATNNSQKPTQYSDLAMAKFEPIIARYTTQPEQPTNSNGKRPGIVQQQALSPIQLLTLTTPRNIFNTPQKQSLNKPSGGGGGGESTLPPRVLTPSLPFDYSFNAEPPRSFEGQNLFGFCGNASHLLAAAPTASITTINFTHPPPPTMDSYFEHHILDFKRPSLTDHKVQSSQFAQSVIAAVSSAHSNTTGNNNTNSPTATIPTNVNGGNHNNTSPNGLLDPDSTLLSEHTLLLAARALKPGKGNIFIMSDDHRVAAFLDRVLTPHQESTPGCDRSLLELSRFFQFEELRLNHKNTSVGSSALPVGMLASFNQDGGNMSRYQKMNAEGKMPNQKPHLDGAKQRAWRLVRKDIQWE